MVCDSLFNRWLLLGPRPNVNTCWYRVWDSNPHDLLGHLILSQACLPVPTNPVQNFQLSKITKIMQSRRWSYDPLSKPGSLVATFPIATALWPTATGACCLVVSDATRAPVLVDECWGVLVSEVYQKPITMPFEKQTGTMLSQRRQPTLVVRTQPRQVGGINHRQDFHVHSMG